MICTTSILLHHPILSQASSHPLHPQLQRRLPVHPPFAVLGMMAPVAGPLVNAGTAIAVRNVKVIIHASTVPFGPQPLPIGAPSQLPHPKANVSGVERGSKPFVNSVHSSRSVSSSSCLVPVPVNVVVPTPQDVLGSSMPSAMAPHLLPSCSLSILGTSQQDLVPPSRVTPIDAEKLQHELGSYPDQTQVDYVISGLTNGFHLGFDPLAVSLKSENKNMPSASLQPSVIDQYLLTELDKGRVAGPFAIAPIPNLHVSRFGIIPKKYQPGKWRLILDLSSPLGHSVNDGIPKEPFSVQYMKVDDVIDGIMLHGRGSLMAKFDVESAYRNVPVHSDDRYLLGMKWRGKYFIDMALPFGLRSAPFIFSSIADMLEWILKHNYNVNFLLHYLDDFHTLGPPNSPVCQNNIATCVKLFKEWGIPLHPNKLEGPCTCLTVLGIELDSLSLQARLPRDKFDRIAALLESWSIKRHCTRKELESLIGNLQHACKVVPQGRTFLRRMINLLSAFRRDDHPIRINQDFRLDLRWWREFFHSWDGLSFLLSPQWASLPDFYVSSDAAGARGYGAIFDHEWFVGEWSAVQHPLSIAYKELFPVVIAASLWGHRWASKRVEFCSDNMAVVNVLRSGTTKDPNMMVLLRHLSLVAARHSFAFTASHTPGKDNSIADALSRFDFQRFHHLAPHAAPGATPIPSTLLAQLPVI